MILCLYKTTYYELIRMHFAILFYFIYLFIYLFFEIDY